MEQIFGRLILRCQQRVPVAKVVPAQCCTPRENHCGAAARPQTIRVPFRSFVPTIFARTVPDASLDLRNVVAFQLALSKFEYDGGLSPAFREGPFELELQDIAVY